MAKVEEVEVVVRHVGLLAQGAQKVGLKEATVEEGVEEEVVRLLGVVLIVSLPLQFDLAALPRELTKPHQNHRPSESITQRCT